MVTINWTITVRNTGAPHDIIAGCSLLHPSTGQEYPLPWWVVWDVPTGSAMTLPMTETDYPIPAGTYNVIARTWTSSSGGTKRTNVTNSDGVIVGATYYGGLLYDWLDEERRTITIAPMAVSADIEQFTITI